MGEYNNKTINILVYKLKYTYTQKKNKQLKLVFPILLILSKNNYNIREKINTNIYNN